VTGRRDRRAADRERGRGPGGRSRQFGASPPAKGGYLTVGVAFVAVLGLLAWYLLSQGPVVRDGSPSWSPDSKQIAYYSERDGKGDLFIMNADGSNVQQLTDLPSDEGSPAFSPDGRQLAFDTDRDGNFEIYVINVAGGRTSRLTSHPGRDVSPAWSPDGKTLAFMSDRDSKPEFDVYLMNADGSGVRRLTAGQSNWFPQFSPDGQRLAFHVWRDVTVFDLATRAAKQLTHDPQNGMHPTWFPDGHRLAFMSWRNGRTALFTVNDDGSNEQPLLQMPTGSAIDPRCSPDGKRVAFVHVPEESADAAQNAALPRAIYTVEVASGRVTRVSR
jgi:Tol biopolymer transport system component